MIPIDTRTTIRSLAGKALACRLRGQYHDAEALYANALEMAEQALEETDPQLASTTLWCRLSYRHRAPVAPRYAFGWCSHRDGTFHASNGWKAQRTSSTNFPDLNLSHGFPTRSISITFHT